ncbi:hypothetical protein [Halorussus marinus]|uniref:hypothetical protein n=1 Tax=Halorussus marinus TaxID=2505976 RepID=UPI0010920DCD|nr:hypothetical protein [Halorussus marinus]
MPMNSASIINKTGEDEIVASEQGVIHEVKFVSMDDQIYVNTTNPLNREDKVAGYVITVDNQRVYDSDLRLDHGESHKQRVNLTPGINVNQEGVIERVAHQRAG